MKNLTFFLLLFPLLGFSQKEFPSQWEAKFTVNAKWKAWKEDLSLVMGGDLADLQMLDGNTGKPLWEVNMKTVFGVKSCDDWAYMEDEELVKVLYTKPKTDTQITEYLDARTGAKVGDATERLKAKKSKTKSSDSRKKPARFVFGSEAYDPESVTFITVSYQDKKFKNAWGGSIFKMDIEATGGYDWKTSFEGKIVAHLLPEMIGEDVILNVFVEYGKVFVVHEGITVFDLKSGKQLWSTTFDYTDTDVGLKAKQEIGRTAWPEVTADAVYICDLTKGEKAIKKLDIETGKVIWTGEKLSKNDIISYLAYTDGNLIVKYGGVILRETYSSAPDGSTVSKVEYTFEGTTSLVAYDGATGKEKWSTSTWDNGDKFKNSPCNLVEEGGKLYICSDKFFYRVDPKSGTAELKTDFGGKAIGMPQYMYFFDGNMIITGDEGIASISQDGKLNYSTSTGKCIDYFWHGNAHYVWTGKDQFDKKDFIRFDLNTGKILGKMEGCYRPRFDETGDYFLFFDDNKVVKYITKG
jgi:hypothetical protein